MPWQICFDLPRNPLEPPRKICVPLFVQERLFPPVDPNPPDPLGGIDIVTLETLATIDSLAGRLANGAGAEIRQGVEVRMRAMAEALGPSVEIARAEAPRAG